MPKTHLGGIRFIRVLTVITVIIATAASQVVAQDTIEEIIVTAQKQMETLQDVPISVTAFSKNNIDNLVAEDLSDIGKFAPNVEVDRGSTQPKYTIRGIGTDDFGIGADPAVGVYIDGVYVGRSGASKVAFNDIERVEILNGPQGTLFGRNAAAGAIQYITNKPVGDKQGWVRGTLGNYDKHKLEGVYNLPLSENLHMRSGVLWNERDGYVDNIDSRGADDFNAEDNWSINSALAWYPTDQTEVVFRLEYDEINAGATAQSSATLPPRDGHGRDFDKVASDTPTYQWRDLFGTSVHVDHEMGALVFSSITAWRQFESKYREERDGSAVEEFRFDDQNYEDNKAFSQEFRITSASDGPLNFTVGASYFLEKAKQTTSIFLSPIAIDKLVVEGVILAEDDATLALLESLTGADYDDPEPGDGLDAIFVIPIFLGGFAGIPREFSSGVEALAANEYQEDIHIDAEYKSYALFADATYAVTEDLDLTVGVRWTKDDKEFSRLVKFNEFGAGFAFTNETRVDSSGELVRDAQGNLDYFAGKVDWYTQNESWEEVTPRAVADYHITEDVLTYLSYSEGFKAGGFNSAGEIAAPSFDPERVKNWELGLKSSWLDYSLRVNAAYFNYDYKNLQKLSTIPNECISNSGTDQKQFETSDVEGDGFELTTVWIPLSGLTVNFNTGTLDAEYKRRIRQRVVAGQCDPVDEKGQAFKESPDINFSLGINYAYAINNGGKLNFGVSYNFEEGVKRDKCKFVEENSNGTVSVYELDTVDGDLVITDGGASADTPRTEPPFSSCPDAQDRKTLNIRIVYVSSKEDWEVSSYMINATDSNYGENKRDDAPPGGLGESIASTKTDGSPTYTRDDPRMYGVELKYLF